MRVIGAIADRIASTSKLMLERCGFYSRVLRDRTGKCLVREFLDELKASDPDDFAAVAAVVEP